MMTQPPSLPAEGRFAGWVTWPLFAVLVYVIHFASAPYFFLYEDDYFHVGLPAVQGWDWVWREIGQIWRTWPQGRPGLFTILALQGGWMASTSSVAWAYLPSFILIVANGQLLFALLRRAWGGFPALAGALIGLVFAADPHRALLTHAPLQLAVAVNLFGLLLYLRGRPVLAWGVAASSLLLYEISFALFLAAEPLRQLEARRAEPKRLVFASGLWFVMPVALFAFRLLQQESRALEVAAAPAELAVRVATNVALGPLYGLQNAVSHPLTSAWVRPSWWPLAIAVLAAASVYAVFRSVRPSAPARPLGGWPTVLLAVGIAAIWLLGPYALQVKRTVFPGFMRPVSGYHLCTGVAFAFVAAWLLAAGARRTRTIAIGALLLIGAASSYQHLLIQADYARSARYQAHFWSEIRRLASDAEPGDVILVPRERLLESTYVLSNSWGVTHGWISLFRQTGPLQGWFGIPGVRPATLFLVPPDWESQVKRDGARVVLELADYTPPGFATGQIPLDPGRVIVIEAEFSAPFRRRTIPIQAVGGEVELKSAPAGAPRNLNYTMLADYLFSNFVN